jgi:transmembrane sensor
MPTVQTPAASQAGAAEAVPDVSHPVMEAAAEWYALLVCGEATSADRTRWQHWLDADAEHRQAWSYVESVDRRMLMPLQQTADPRLTSDSLWAAQHRLLKRRRVLARVAAIAGIGVLGWSAWYREQLGQFLSVMAAAHRTGTGEIREVALEDGTHVWLNTASAFDADYQPALRRLHLAAGEVLVTTAADALRPFVVDTTQGRLRALGTRFTVRLEDDKTFLAVYQGKVEIRTAGSGTTVVLGAGQQTLFDRDAIQPAVRADTARQAWSQGQLIAWDLPLDEVVKELRRYYSGHLGVAPELAKQRIFGTYPLHDVPATLDMLAEAVHARVRRPLPWWISLEAGNPVAGPRLPERSAPANGH